MPAFLSALRALDVGGMHHSRSMGFELPSLKRQASVFRTLTPCAGESVFTVLARHI